MRTTLSLLAILVTLFCAGSRAHGNPANASYFFTGYFRGGGENAVELKGPQGFVTGQFTDTSSQGNLILDDTYPYGDIVFWYTFRPVADGTLYFSGNAKGIQTWRNAYQYLEEIPGVENLGKVSVQAGELIWITVRELKSAGINYVGSSGGASSYYERNHNIRPFTLGWKFIASLGNDTMNRAVTISGVSGSRQGTGWFTWIAPGDGVAQFSNSTTVTRAGENGTQLPVTLSGTRRTAEIEAGMLFDCEAGARYWIRNESATDFKWSFSTEGFVAIDPSLTRYTASALEVLLRRFGPVSNPADVTICPAISGHNTVIHFNPGERTKFFRMTPNDAKRYAWQDTTSVQLVNAVGTRLGLSSNTIALSQTESETGQDMSRLKLLVGESGIVETDMRNVGTENRYEPDYTEPTSDMYWMKFTPPDDGTFVSFFSQNTVQLFAASASLPERLLDGLHEIPAIGNLAPYLLATVQKGVPLYVAVKFRYVGTAKLEWRFTKGSVFRSAPLEFTSVNENQGSFLSHIVREGNLAPTTVYVNRVPANTSYQGNPGYLAVSFDQGQTEAAIDIPVTNDSYVNPGRQLYHSFRHDTQHLFLSAATPTLTLIDDEVLPNDRGEYAKDIFGSSGSAAGAFAARTNNSGSWPRLYYKWTAPKSMYVQFAIHSQSNPAAVSTINQLLVYPGGQSNQFNNGFWQGKPAAEFAVREGQQFLLDIVRNDTTADDFTLDWKELPRPQSDFAFLYVAEGEPPQSLAINAPGLISHTRIHVDLITASSSDLVIDNPDPYDPSKIRVSSPIDSEHEEYEEYARIYLKDFSGAILTTLLVKITNRTPSAPIFETIKFPRGRWTGVNQAGDRSVSLTMGAGGRFTAIITEHGKRFKRTGRFDNEGNAFATDAAGIKGFGFKLSLSKGSGDTYFRLVCEDDTELYAGVGRWESSIQAPFTMLLPKTTAETDVGYATGRFNKFGAVFCGVLPIGVRFTASSVNDEFFTGTAGGGIRVMGIIGGKVSAYQRGDELNEPLYSAICPFKYLDEYAQQRFNSKRSQYSLEFAPNKGSGFAHPFDQFQLGDTFDVNRKNGLFRGSVLTRDNIRRSVFGVLFEDDNLSFIAAGSFGGENWGSVFVKTHRGTDK